MKMIHHLTRAGLLLMLMLLLATTSVMAAIQVDLNGSPMTFSVPPTQINGTTMVPMRGIFEALGAHVDWNAGTRMITANKGDTEVQLTLNDPHAKVNGRTVLLDTPAMVSRGSTMVPLRFISEALGADVKWFAATQTVYITTSADSGIAPPPVDQGALEPSYSSGPATNYPGQPASFTPGELDVLLGPIALYPDPLIAQILPAATFPDQLTEADDYIGQRGTRNIDSQDWDVSVKAIAYYPSVLRMMVDKPDWTTAVGQAYVDDPDQVMRCIQRLRSRAKSYGYLSTNQYQRVYDDAGYVRVVPVQSQYLYVPTYDPQVVYVQRRSSSTSNIISFGLGLLIGSWLNRDVDWGHDRVYYHGWEDRSGWIGRSRPHVETRDNPYVNDRYRRSPISVDRRVTDRNIQRFRNDIRRNVGTYRLPDSQRSDRQGDHSRPSNRDGRDGQDNRGDQRDSQQH